MAALCRHYRWPHDFWRRMGRREFFAWVEQLQFEVAQESGEMTPDSWRNVEQNDWWQKAKEKRNKLQGR